MKKNEKPKMSSENASVKQLIKPIDILNEEQFFEVQALCKEFGAGIECKGVNGSIDEENHLLF